MYPIPPSENLVELRTCRQCSADFPITDKDMEFYEKVSPVFGNPFCKEGGSLEGNGSETGDFVSETTEKNPPPPPSAPPLQRRFTIPPPTLCPDCRQQRRLAFRNERKLYKRKCDATGKEMLSMFSPDSLFRVYHPDAWYKHDFLKEGISIDSKKSFFDQFYSLLLDVPQIGLSVASNLNCDFTNQCGNSKDCYYSFDVGMAENCLYSNFIDDSTSLVDCSSTHESHYCCDCVDTIRCSQCISLLRCEDCSYSRRLVDCIGCEYCIECVNLKNKKYYYRNTQYSREEWENIDAQYRYNVNEWAIFLNKQPRKNLYIIGSEESLGDTISYSKNTISSFETKDAENVKYIDRSRILKDCMDIRGFGNNLELSYECLSVGINAYNILFSSHCWSEVSRLSYCHYCIHGTTDCFGCIGLRNKSYCILNRQYTKEEYESLVPRIIEKMMAEGEWGEFFPASLSPFGYNETVAQEYFPLSREEVRGSHPEFISGSSFFVAKGEDAETSSAGPNTFLHGPIFNWSDYESPFPQVEKVIPASKLPDTIEGIPDDILNWAIECEVSGKPFRIIRQELEFYRKHSLPIPRRHLDVRHMDRMKMRNPRKLFERLCDCEQCEENWKKKGVILREWEDAEYKTTEQNPQSPLSSSTAPFKRSLRKKMITTYAPERPETVYCEGCYEREAIG